MLSNMNNSTLLVFPTSRAIRQYIQLHKNSNCLLPKTITIGDFFSYIITIGTKQYCDVDLRVLYLKQALQNINIDALGINKDFNSLLKQSEYLFRFFAELTHENKTIDQLYDVDTYALYHDHLDLLKSIYEQYCLILNKNNIVDKITLPFNYELNRSYIKQFEKIIIYYEGYFSLYEFNLIKEVSKIVDLNIIYTQNRFNKKNLQIFDCLDIDKEQFNEYNLNLSKNKIEAKNKIETIDQIINIEPISSRINQIGLIKHAIVTMINNSIKPEDIVVVLPDESFHEMLALFDNEHYFNFSMGNSIKNNKIIKVANAIYKILLDFEPKDKDKLEKYNLDYEMLIKTFGINFNKNINKTIYDKLIELLLSYETNEEVLKKIEIILIGLEKLLFHKTVQISFKDGFKILLQKLSSITIDDINGGKITVMGLLETRAMSFEGVIVVDFNDHIIPKRSVKDKFISTNIKKHLGLPTIKDREDLQKYYYYKLFSSAKMITICYVQDEQNQLSRFAHEIFESNKFSTQIKLYENILYNLQPLKADQNEIIVDIDLSANEWSATSLKRYLQCKRAYYYKYIKKIDEHHISIKPQGFELGNIIHKALEDFYKSGGLKIDIEQSIKTLNSYIDRYIGKNSYLILEAQIFKRKLIKYIKNEHNRAEEIKNILALEQQFKIKHNGVVLKGSIDRIDILNDDSFLVLDYKTSSSLKIDSEKNYEKTSDFQLEFYYLAVLNNFAKNQTINCAYYDLNSGEIKQEIVLDEKLVLLEKKLNELKTKQVNFSKCEDQKLCEYCDYKMMCGR
jgi:RecB family exonuclease